MSTPTSPTLRFHVPHKPRSTGAGPLSLYATMLAFVLTIAVVLVATFVGFAAAAVLFVLSLAGMAILTVPDRHGHTEVTRMGRRLGHRKTVKQGASIHTPGALGKLGEYRAPGTSANSELTTHEDSQRNEYAMLTYPSTKHHVIAFRAHPFGVALTGKNKTDDHVEHFQDWLSGLAHEPGLRQAAIGIEFSADSLPALQREIKENLSDKASDVSKLLFTQMLKQYPTGGVSSRADVSMTFKTPATADKAEKQLKSATVMERRLAARLPVMLAELPGTGAGPSRLMTAEDYIETVRCAYNPADRKLYQQLRASGEQTPVMLWNSVGPTGAHADKTFYWHSGYTSVSWEKTGFTSNEVSVQCLAPLLDLPEGIDVLRITLLYEPVSPALAAHIAEHDHKQAENRESNQKKPTASAKRDVAHADKTRHAEAAGASLMNFAVIVTASVKDPEPEYDDGKITSPDRKSARAIAEAAIDHAGPSARLKLRRFDGAQQQAFAQGIPALGLVTEDHLLIPASIRTGL